MNPSFDTLAPFCLTPRELDVMRTVATGASNRDAARSLNVSEDTVKRHITHIFDKCGLSNRVELALFAVRHHVIHP